MAQCVFKTKKELREAIEYEKKMYRDLIVSICRSYFFAVVVSHPLVNILKWQVASRTFDWYSSRPRSFFNMFPYTST